MKKALALILTFVMMLSLAACGGGNDDKTPDNSAPSTPITPSNVVSNAGGYSNEVHDVSL